MTNIIKVRFNKDGQPQGREYSYLSPVEVEVGDIVEMETQRGIAKGTVTQINVPTSEIEPFKDRVKSIIGLAPIDEPEPMKTIERAKALIESLTPLQEDPEAELYLCPRCGHDRMKKPAVKNALSRRANVYICSECGQEEAMLDAVGNEPLPLNQWAMVIGFDKN